MALIDLDGSNDSNLVDLDAPVKPPADPGGGLIASAKQSVGATIKGAGQAAADFIPGVDRDNVVSRYGQSIVDANPTAVQSLGDIVDKPLTAVAEATGNAVGSMGGMLGARALGMGITAAAPLTGPLAPVTAAIGQAVSWLAPAAIAALPSFGSIRDEQILADPANEKDAKALALATLGAGAVGAIETVFGPQQWALSAMTREGRVALAEKFAKLGAGSLPAGVAKAAAMGAAVEGAEELAQNPIEQLAAFKDPTTPENIQQTVFGGAMGAIGGGVLGGGFGAVFRAPNTDEAIRVAQDAAFASGTDTATAAIDEWKTGDMGATGLLGAPSVGPTLIAGEQGVGTPEQQAALVVQQEQERLSGMTAPAEQQAGLITSVPVIGEPTITPDTSGGRTDTTGVRADDLLIPDTATPAVEPLVTPQARVLSDIEAYQSAEQKQARGELLTTYERAILDAGPVATPDRIVPVTASAAEQRTVQRKLEREGSLPTPVPQQQLAAQETPALGQIPTTVGGVNEAQLDNEQLTAIIANPATHANTRRAAQAVLGSRMSQPRGQAQPEPTQGAQNGQRLQDTQTSPEALNVAEVFGAEAQLRTASEAPQPGERVTTPMRAALTQIGRLTGTKVVFVSAEGADGATRSKDGNTVYVNVRSSINPLQVMGHEVTHVLRKKHREAWASIRAAVEANTDDAVLAEFARDYWSVAGKERIAAMDAAEDIAAWLKQKPADVGVTSSEASVRDFLMDEMISDLGGNRWSDPEFWSNVFQNIEEKHGKEQAKTIIQKMVAAIKELISRFMMIAKRDGFAEFKTEGMVARRVTPEQLKAIQTAIENAYAGFISAERTNEPSGYERGVSQRDVVAGSGDDELAALEAAQQSTARSEDRPDYVVEKFEPAANITIAPMTPERLRTLRRAASLLERPRDGVLFRITEDGEAIATGEPGTKIPNTMRDFARKYGLEFEARRVVRSAPAAGGQSMTLTNKTEPMPATYREAGALYAAEMGNNRTTDSTEYARFSPKRTSDVGHKRSKSGDYVGAPPGMTSAKLGPLRTRLRALADEGKQGRMWYEESGKAILEAAEGSIQLAEKIAGLLAIYSPQATVSGNTSMGLKALYQWMNGQPIKARMAVQDAKAQAWMDGTMVEEDALQIKTGNFFRNLMRKIDESRYGFDKQGATIDMWMARVFGYNSKAIGSSARYNFAEREVKRLADELNWEPQQVQAALWVAIKSRIESIADVAREYGQKQGWLKRVERGGNISWSPVDAGARDKYEAYILKLALATSPDPKGLAGASYNFGTALKERIGQISWEAMPGRTSGVLPGIFNAPLDQQLAYLVAIDAALRDENGNDVIAARLGLPVLYTNMGPSAWEGTVGAGAQTTVAIATDRDKSSVSVNPNARALLNAYAAIRGYALSQEAVVWHYPIFSASKKDANGVQIDIGRDPTTDETRTLYAAVSAAAGRTDWAPAYVPNVGWRILNFDGNVSNIEFAKQIKSVLSSLPDMFPASEFKTFKSDGDYISNDWKENKNGEGYRSWISGAGRSDLQGWVEGDLRDRTRRVEEEFAERYGWGRPDATGDRPAGESVTQQSLPRYGTPADQHAISVTGVHYSREQRQTLSSAFFGTGMKGEEGPRVRAAADPRIKRRLYFYTNTGRGITPEADVGIHAHSVGLDNVYDMDVDPLKLYVPQRDSDPYRSVNQRMNDFESSVIDAGYDGYMTREFGTGGAVVLLGNHAVPVQYEGTGARPDVVTTPEPRYDDLQLLQQRIATNRALPSGQMSGADWKRLLMAVMPEVDPRWLDNNAMYYKGDLLKGAAQRSEPRQQADAIKAMSDDERDNLDPYAFGYRGYVLYEAEKMMPKKDGAFKAVNDNNSFALWQEADAVVNVGGKPYLATKQEDPDDDADEGLYVWSFLDPELGGTGSDVQTDWADKVEAVAQLREKLKGAVQRSERRMAPNGEPSKLTEQQWLQVRTPEFKAWFGDWEKHAKAGTLWSDDTVSKVVDENGEPLVVYHGTKQGGFRVFRPEKGDKHRSPMIFATNDRRTARTYSGRGDEIIFDDQFKVVAVGDKFIVSNTAYPAEDALAYKYDSREEAQDEADEMNDDGTRAGIYEVFLNIRNPNESDFEGANWDGQWGYDDWQVVDADQETQYASDGRGVLREAEARRFLSELGGEEAGYAVVKPDYRGETTNSVAEEALRYGNDGAIIRNVVDDGGQYSSADQSDVFVFFDSNQVKSATQNTGTFSRTDPDIRRSEARTSWYYSELARAIDTAPAKAFTTGKQFSAWLTSNTSKLGVKKDEIQWTGITDWLATQGKVTREDVAAYLKQGGIQVEETVLGEKAPGWFVRDNVTRAVLARDFDTDWQAEEWADANGHDDVTIVQNDEERGSAKFSGYKLPGGENYREVLLTLPGDNRNVTPAETARFKQLDAMRLEYMTDTEFVEYDKLLVKHEGRGSSQFRSSHWDQSNVIAHMRVDTVEGADGKRYLRVIEIQSDWGQKGKKEGFADPAKKAKGIEEAQAAIDLIRAEAAEAMPSQDWADYNNGEAIRVMRENDYPAMSLRMMDAVSALQQINRSSDGIPSAPFVTDTKSWTALIIKRAIRMAAEEGHDGIVFATGEQNVDLYDLSKQIDAVRARRDGPDEYTIIAEKQGGGLHEFGQLSGRGLEEHVGKELATKIQAQTEDFKRYAGLDLKVGGEGMRAFYDQIVPQVTRDVLKKLGAGDTVVGDVAVMETNDGYRLDPDMDDAGNIIDRGLEAEHIQPGFLISDKLRASAMSGMPLFSEARDRTNLDTANRRMSKFVDAFVTGDVKSSDTQILGDMPVVMRAVGAPDLPLEIDGATLEKVLAGKHKYAITADMMKQLPDGLYDPLALFMQPEGGVRAITELTTDGGNPVVVGVHFTVASNRMKVNRIATVYEYERAGERFMEQAKNLRYVRNEEALKISSTPATPFRAEVVQKARELGANILSESDIVKLYQPARYSTPRHQIPQMWQDDSKLDAWDNLTRKLQDKLIDTKRIVAAIREAGIAIKDKFDPYLQETLFHGRAATAVSRFAEDELRPLYVEMQGRGVKQQDLDDYLWARHATERNAQIAKVNPNMSDGGSGLTDRQAADILAGRAVTLASGRTIQLQTSRMASYAALAVRVDAITKRTGDLLVASGLESQETVDKWRSTYGKYVPLMRDMETDDNYLGAMGLGMGTGQGFNVRGSASKRAQGSGRDVVDVLANVAMQRERAITRAEKNRVSTAVYGLALTAPNPEFWLPINPDSNNPALQQKVEDELVTMGLSRTDAAAIAKEPTQTYIDQNGMVAQRVNPQLRGRENVLALRVNGQDRYVFFSSDERAQQMVRNLKNLDNETMGEIMSHVATVTRYFSSINTQFNPVFGLTNGIRDLGTGMLNLSSTPLKGQRKRVLAYAMSALRGVYSDLRDHRAGRQPTSRWALEFEEFQREGGQTGYRDMFATSKDRAEAIAKEIQNAGKGKSLLALDEKRSPIFGWLSDYNTSIENAIRLAAYKVAKEDGMSTQRAAELAKNITVNFNKKGLAATQAGAMYAFFNAAVQGTARIGATMVKRDPQTGKVGLTDAGKKIAYGGVMFGVMQALMLSLAGYDDEEPPQFIREKNIIIPMGYRGKYVSLPMPLGFHVIPNLGRIPTEFILNGFRKPGDRMVQLFRVVGDAFNPIGSSTPLQMVTPTIVDPLAALAENKDWSGKSIYKEDFNKMEPTAGWTRKKDTSSDLSRWLAYSTNYITGGGKYGIGIASPTPDQIDYLIGQATGGVGRESLKLWQAAKTPLTGEELPMYKFPVAGRFIGNTSGQESQASKFYDNLKRIGEHDSALKEIKRARDTAAYVEYLRENPDARQVKLADKASRDVSLLKRQKRDALEKGDAERVKLIERQLESRIGYYNKLLSDRKE